MDKYLLGAVALILLAIVLITIYGQTEEGRLEQILAKLDKVLAEKANPTDPVCRDIRGGEPLPFRCLEPGDYEVKWFFSTETVVLLSKGAHYGYLLLVKQPPDFSMRVGETFRAYPPGEVPPGPKK